MAVIPKIERFVGRLVSLVGTVTTASRSTSQRGGELDADGVRGLYSTLAEDYDVLSSVYRLLGAGRLALRGIDALGLQAGDTVVDLGCGTGTYLPRLAEEVGPSGRVVGVDLSPEMLAQARDRVSGLEQVELVEADIRTFELPAELDAALATFALEMVPAYDQVIARVCRVLRPARGRIAVMGLRESEAWPRWLVRVGVALARPFGVDEAYTDHRPWEAIRQYADEVLHDSTAGGAIYLSVGEPG